MRFSCKPFTGLSAVLWLLIAGTLSAAPIHPVHASRAMVASVHELASRAGTQIMQAGGNAVDAAVAVGFALAVVHPEAGNLGGRGFMLIRPRDGTVQTLDYRETAPARASRDMYLDAKGEPTDRSLTGELAAGVARAG